MENRMTSSTRQKMIYYFQEHTKASAPELGRALNVTRAAVRYHLESLSKEGLLEIDPDESAKSKRRGRPILFYRLVSTGRPNNLTQLSDVLLEYSLGIEGINRNDFLHNLAESIAGQLDLPSHLTQRLNRIIQILNQKHYQARWEAHAKSPHVTFKNCPYAAIIQNHPELCQMDLYLLEELTGQPVEQVAKINLYHGSPPACLFVLKTN